MSRRIDPLLDEADPIPQSYYLRSGPPAWTVLWKRFPFPSDIGQKVTVGLFQPLNGEKEPVCTLKEYRGKSIVVTDADGQDHEFVLSELRFVRRKDDLPF